MPDVNALKELLGLKLPAHPSKVVVFAPQCSARLLAVCDFIFHTALHCDYQVLTDVPSENDNVVHVNYSNQKIEGALQIIPAALLFENSIRQFEPECFTVDHETYFFQTNGDWPFDIFSAVFYFISRYEEWQNFEKDQHDRFEIQQSILYRLGLHKRPIVEEWILNLKNHLNAKFRDLKIVGRHFQVMSSLDIDNLFAYKGKSVFRSTGATIKDLIRGDIKNIINRFNVLVRKQTDPFDVYESLSEFCFEKKIPLFCFFLQRNNTQYDRTLNPKSPFFASTIKTLQSNFAFIGLHPSYDAIKNERLLVQEIKNLQASGLAQVNLSRQHFLRFDIQKTPNQLLKNGITFDFTMGYAAGQGLRAGTTLPFNYFDFNTESPTELVFVPFCAMDGVWTVYSEASAALAEKEMMEIANNIQKVEGIFLTVFHERTFSDHLYKGFGTLYKNLYSGLSASVKN